jgi:DNA invertase Pin-like site-specific DNA recombinase
LISRVHVLSAGLFLNGFTVLKTDREEAMKRIFVYSRVSSSTQNISSQELQLKKLIESRSDWEVVAEFSDKAYKGDNFSTRPAFNEMLKRAKAGEADLIVVFQLSRLGRSLSHIVSIVSELAEAGVGVYSMTEQLDSSLDTIYGKVILAVYSALNEVNLSLIRSAVRAGVERKRKEILEDGGHWGRPFASVDIGLLTKLRFEQHMSYRKIAKRLGCSCTTVVRRLSEIAPYHKPIVG